MKHSFKASALILLAACCSSTALAQQPASTESDLWAFTDGLGRKARTHADAGDKKDRLVAMFYWTWHQMDERDDIDVINISEVTAKYPEAMKDYNHPAWGGDKRPDTYFWGQSIFGYYRTTDPWVLRKHAELLADAGVDVVFFDCTNGSYTWSDSYNKLMEVWDQAQKDGVNVPKICFLLPFAAHSDTNRSLRKLYANIYSINRYPNLWFYWEGKPLIGAWNDALGTEGTDQEIRDFFTFRPFKADYRSVQNGKWAWLETMPTHGCGVTLAGTEQAPVSVAQNARKASNGLACSFSLRNTYGRSYTSKGWDKQENSYLYGANFQEQWDRAIDVLKPRMIFVTGWNEYVSGMYTKADGWDDPLSFADQFDWEHSRDCEPVKEWGDNGDAYYSQLIDNVRRFKGMSAPSEPHMPCTIKIGRSGEWNKASATYKAYRGNTFHRNHRGRYSSYYVNETGRNDICGAAVAHDNDNIYFRVETAEALTDPSGQAWMQLFIDADRDKSTGWNGYDFVINRTSPTASEVIVEKCVDNSWQWQQAGTGRYVVTGNVLEIEISRSLLAMDNNTPDFEFKWNDNMQQPGNIMDFYVNGDTAPGARFNYIYTADPSGDTSGIETVKAATLSVKATGAGLQIECDRAFCVYSSAGVLIGSGNGSALLPVTAPGLYIVTAPGKTVKISVP